MRPLDKPPGRQLRQRGGRRSREKGNRAERAIVAFLQDSGFAAERVPLSGSAGGKYVGDVTIPLLGRDLCAEAWSEGAGAAERLGCSTKTIQRLIARGELAVVRITERIPGITDSEIDRFVAARTTGGAS